HNVDYLTGEMDFYSLIAGNNILLTYAIFLLILKCLEEFKEQANFFRFGWLIVGILLSMMTIPFCEGALQLLPLLYIFYFCYGNKRRIIFGVLIYSFMWLVKAISNYLAYGMGVGLLPTLSYNCEFMMSLVCLAIISYDGTKGKKGVLGKWSFYVIYPVHIWLLRILSLL
ncbi:MAG: TraX family protein, partial [Erysipelotrichaceae bacterium]|nr:TraX family protein [Erysipelotrichaceae bacterium]